MFYCYSHRDLNTKTGEPVSVTGKSNRQLDREAFQPRGEATHTPDHHLDSRHGGHDRLDSEGYPNADESTSKACRGCGQPISANQRKCATCLRYHIEPVDTDVGEQADQTPVPRVIFAVVEAACDYTALAKGAAACTLLEQRESNPLEDCQLIDELSEPPATTLRDTWGDLPPAVRIESENGSQLLSVALKHIDGTEEGAREEDEQSISRLYDESGRGIRDKESWIDTANDERWLVPAIGVEQRPAENRTTRRNIQSSYKRYIDCHCCEEATEHRFSEYEQLPDGAWDGQPIWQCQACGTTRYGPVSE